MQVHIDCVGEFHRKMGVSATEAFPKQAHGYIGEIARTLLLMAADAEKHIKEDKRFLRIHLSLEELGEWCEALAACDEAKALDALADRLYVLFGDAVTWDLPLADAFEEVHASNMTKVPQDSDPLRERVRDKGPDFKPPRLAELLSEYRSKPTQATLQSFHSRRLKDYPWMDTLDRSQRAVLKKIAEKLAAGTITEKDLPQ